MTVDEYWARFLDEKGLDKSTEYVSDFYFDLTEENANYLLGLVLCGKKRATASSIYAFTIDGDKMPEPDDYNIVTDWDGNPRCIIRTTAVTRLPFKDITFDICKREGEDDTLESWQNGHRWFFTEEGKELGYEFDESMEVVFEDFEVVYQ